VQQVLLWLGQAGARADVAERARLHTEQAIAALERAGGSGPAQDELLRQAQSYLKRTS
jgi:geranylgeranyl pyrophosphate synthase